MKGADLTADEAKKWCFACNLIKSLDTRLGIITYTFPRGKKFQYSGFSSNQRQACVSDHSIISEIKVDENYDK